MIDDIELKRSMCFGKKAYSTEKYANRVAADAMSKRKVELRVYQCPICGQFNITSLMGIEDRGENYARI